MRPFAVGGWYPVQRNPRGEDAIAIVLATAAAAGPITLESGKASDREERKEPNCRL